ncbi:MAG: hypothetical protein WCS03_07255 [Bacteroidota bacterium]
MKTSVENPVRGTSFRITLGCNFAKKLIKKSRVQGRELIGCEAFFDYLTTFKSVAADHAFLIANPDQTPIQ